MNTFIGRCAALVILALAPLSAVMADEYDDTIQAFKNAGESGHFFQEAYGYAVFPTIAKGGLGVGAAHGKGRVYEKGKYVGDAAMTQITAGFQAGGQAFSEIIFFKDEAAFNDFTRGNFEFGAEAQAVAITAGASAGTSTTGSSASASASRNEAANVGAYTKGMAVFTLPKGGLMYEAAVGGQKFKYTPVSH